MLNGSCMYVCTTSSRVCGAIAEEKSGQCSQRGCSTLLAACLGQATMVNWVRSCDSPGLETSSAPPQCNCCDTCTEKCFFRTRGNPFLARNVDGI